ncbi:MAG: glycosyltransferase family 4 protein [Desulfobacteraceae bacterium]|nr:glycosyltransferase family 4 protein [Desulfobacteraceae bacterium]
MAGSYHIGVIVPWFGRALKGGAEQQAYQIAHRLLGCGHRVTVLTTCSKSFFDSWSENFWPQGEVFDGPLRILRFALSSRDQHRFELAVAKLLGSSFLTPGIAPIPALDEADYWENNISSKALVDYLARQESEYDYFIFLPYLFTLCIRGVAAVPHKSLIQPCLHDEPYAYLRAVQIMMHQAARILFNSAGEYHLARRLFGGAIEKKSVLVGEGIEISFQNASISARAVPRPYLLCLGKRGTVKNTPLLIDFFRSFKTAYPDVNLCLVLAGPGELGPGDPCDDIVDLGMVDEGLKENLLVNTLALVNLSLNESFSRVIHEAWIAQRPVIIHKECLATMSALEESGFAGWGVSTQTEFNSALQELTTAPESIHGTLGRRGQQYALDRTGWDAVMARYQTVFEKIEAAEVAVGISVDPCPEEISDFQNLCRLLHPRMARCVFFKAEDLSFDLISGRCMDLFQSKVERMVFYQPPSDDLFTRLSKAEVGKKYFRWLGRAEALQGLDLSPFDHCFVRDETTHHSAITVPSLAALKPPTEEGLLDFSLFDEFNDRRFNIYVESEIFGREFLMTLADDFAANYAALGIRFLIGGTIIDRNDFIIEKVRTRASRFQPARNFRSAAISSQAALLDISSEDILNKLLFLIRHSVPAFLVRKSNSPEVCFGSHFYFISPAMGARSIAALLRLALCEPAAKSLLLVKSRPFLINCNMTRFREQWRQMLPPGTSSQASPNLV